MRRLNRGAVVILVLSLMSTVLMGPGIRDRSPRATAARPSATTSPTLTPTPSAPPTPEPTPPAPAVVAVLETPTPPAFLTIAGTAFNYRGQRVMLRGVNVTNGAAGYEVDDASYNMDEGIAKGQIFRTLLTEDESDYARLESWGVNVIRFGLDWHWYAANRGNFYAFMDQHIAWARAHHMWLIPNMGGAPGGLQDYSGGCRFWNLGDSTYRDLLRAFWVDFARRYANEPQIAGYDLMNEPSAATCNAPPDNNWWPYAGQLRNAVYGVDKNHFVVIESHDDGLFTERLPEGNPVKYPNVVYSDHGYLPISMTHNGVFDAVQPYTYPGPAPDYDGTIRNWSRAELDYQTRVLERGSVAFSRRENVPLFIGEEGTVKQLNGYLRLIADQISLMNDPLWGTHWTVWSYRDYDLVTNFGVYNDGTNPVIMTSALPPSAYDGGMLAILRAGMAGNIRPR